MRFRHRSHILSKILDVPPILKLSKTKNSLVRKKFSIKSYSWHCRVVITVLYMKIWSMTSEKFKISKEPFLEITHKNDLLYCMYYRPYFPSVIFISLICLSLFLVRLHVFYKHNVYKHTEAQISKKLSIS